MQDSELYLRFIILTVAIAFLILMFKLILRLIFKREEIEAIKEIIYEETENVLSSDVVIFFNIDC